MKTFITLLLTIVMLVIGGIGFIIRTIVTISLFPLFIITGFVIFIYVMSINLNIMDRQTYMNIAKDNPFLKIQSAITKWLHTLDRDILKLALILSNIILRRVHHEKSN